MPLLAQLGPEERDFAQSYHVYYTEGRGMSALGVCVHCNIIHIHQNYALSLTGTVSQVLLMNCNLPDDWLYDRVMLQVLGTAGTINNR